jgi:hypothetical protein
MTTPPNRPLDLGLGRLLLGGSMTASESRFHNPEVPARAGAPANVEQYLRIGRSYSGF